MAVFWGEGGQYGPYVLQEDGWPNAGQVMRDFRQQLGLTAEDAAKVYTERLQMQASEKEEKKPIKAVTASWIINMENENRVPATIGRRRILADMFQIPYALFGLAPLSQVTFRPTFDDPLNSSLLIQSAIEDTRRYDKEINLLWQLYYTNTASNLIADIDLSIGVLETAQKMSQGRFKEHILSLLNSYYALGAGITRSTGRQKKSLLYADNAIRVAKEMRQEHLIAYSLYTRGYTHLVGGLYEEKDQDNTFKVNIKKITHAINDFEQALPSASPQLKGLIWLELSRAYVHLHNSKSNITIALEHSRRAKDYIDTWEVDSRQIPINGLTKGLNEGAYRIGNAITLTAVGRSEKAQDELDYLTTLRDARGIERNQVRRQAWIDIVYAQAALSSKNYCETTIKLVNAFIICKEINMNVNIDIINSMYHQLIKSSYKNNTDVIDLKHMLDEHYQTRKGIE